MELKNVVLRAMEQLEREDGRLDHLRLMEHAMPKLKEQLLQRLIAAPADTGSTRGSPRSFVPAA